MDAATLPLSTEEARQISEADCLICCRPIGAQDFYRLSEGLVHASCFNDKAQGDY